MPIGINGTIVTNNRINGTSISSETVNGTQVYGGTISRVWYWYSEDSSEPSEYTPYTTTSASPPTRAILEGIMTSTYPPANIPVGTLGWIYHTNNRMYYMLMIVEE